MMQRLTRTGHRLGHRGGGPSRGQLGPDDGEPFGRGERERAAAYRGHYHDPGGSLGGVARGGGSRGDGGRVANTRGPNN